MPNVDNSRGLYKALLLYDDDKTHQRAMQLIKENYLFLGILHDKDVDEKGQPKKPHFHYIIKLDTPTRNSTIARKLGIAENYVQVLISKRGARDYLTHKFNEDKYKYDESSVFGNLDLTEKDEYEKENRFTYFSKLIFENKIDSVGGLIQLAINSGYYDVLKANTYLYIQLIKEFKNTIDKNNK